MIVPIEASKLGIRATKKFCPSSFYSTKKSQTICKNLENSQDFVLTNSGRAWKCERSRVRKKCQKQLSKLGLAFIFYFRAFGSSIVN